MGTNFFKTVFNNYFLTISFKINLNTINSIVTFVFYSKCFIFYSQRVALHFT